MYSKFMHGLEFTRLSDKQFQLIDRLLAAPLRRVLRLPSSVHSLLILAIFGLPSSEAVRHALVLKFHARTSLLPPSHPSRELLSSLSDDALFPAKGSVRFRSFLSDVTVAKKYLDESPSVLTSTRLFVAARSISLKLLKQAGNTFSSIKHFLDRNPTFSYTQPSFLKRDDPPAAIMRCRLFLSNSHFETFHHRFCPDCSPLVPFTDVCSALSHISSCRLINPFLQCNNTLRFHRMSPLVDNSLLSLPRSSRFVSYTTKLLRALYYYTFPP